MRPLVITHKDCFDGHTAAWIYSRFVNMGSDAEFVPARYGDAPPSCKDRDVVIADFSYPRGEMFRIGCDAKSLVVLDHHKTAEEALLGLEAAIRAERGDDFRVRVVFDMNRSGAGIVWDFYRGGDRPMLVDQVEARDLWKTDDFDADYMANVYAAPMTFEEWDRMNAASFTSMISDGAAIGRYIRQYGTKALAEARLHFVYDRPGGVLLVDGKGTWTVNLPYMNCSDHLSRLMAEKDADFVMGYFCRNDGRWQFSLRSRNGFDCSAVAKAYGGGGHKEASGFDVASLETVFGELPTL